MKWFQLNVWRGPTDGGWSSSPVGWAWATAEVAGYFNQLCPASYTGPGGWAIWSTAASVQYEGQPRWFQVWDPRRIFLFWLYAAPSTAAFLRSCNKVVVY